MQDKLEASTECKYVFSPALKVPLEEWLEAFCRRDARFPSSRVSSLYYDSTRLGSYLEKRDGDYLKTKLRLRWYPDRERGLERDTQVTAYLEVKGKEGARRSKRRTPVSLLSNLLLDEPFSAPEVCRLAWEAGTPLSQPLLPALVVQFERHRFVDLETGSRISLDTEISSPRANSDLFGHILEVDLPIGVLEIKGRDGELPRALRPLSAFLRRTSVSKYALLVERRHAPGNKEIYAAPWTS